MFGGGVGAQTKRLLNAPRNQRADWQVFRELRPLALDRFCLRVLDEVAELSCSDATAHKRYLAVFKLIQRRDAELAASFDEPRRSTAVQQLVCLRSLDL